MDLRHRLRSIDFTKIGQTIDEKGWAQIPEFLPPNLCENLRDLYDKDKLYRNTISMARYGFGRGEYRYFAYPLPDIIQSLRVQLYPPLADIANRWNKALGKDKQYPNDHADYLNMCQESHQSRPTPLILKYGKGDYNCLHQDLYGKEIFPLQLAILLSKPEQDFEGGAFVMTEQRPRMQSRPHIAPLKQGDAVIFAVNEFPRLGSRGYYRVKMRHGVSEVSRGDRHTLGIIFHDAE